ncbi:MAG: cupin domain-containing protein, partial [Planctomycetota bacterium]
MTKHLPSADDLNIPRTDFPPYDVIDMGLGGVLDNLQISQVTAIQYRCTSRWHMRPRRIADDMFFLILSGRGEMVVGGQRLSMEPGDCIHWRRGERHSASTAADDPITVIAFHYTATVAGSCTLAELLGFPSRFKLGHDHPIAALLGEACREYALHPPGYERSLEALT